MKSKSSSLKNAVLLACDMIALIPNSDREAWDIHTSICGNDWYAFVQRNLNGLGDTIQIHRITLDGEQHYEVSLRTDRIPRIPEFSAATPAEAISALKSYLKEMEYKYGFTAGWLKP